MATARMTRGTAAALISLGLLSALLVLYLAWLDGWILDWMHAAIFCLAIAQPMFAAAHTWWPKALLITLTAAAAQLCIGAIDLLPVWLGNLLRGRNFGLGDFIAVMGLTVVLPIAHISLAAALDRGPRNGGDG